MADETPSLKILHLAFEDHRRPGSGGGGLRTHEINRRLAARHDVQVVVAPYKGMTRRVEDGVVYRPLGMKLGYLGSMITYHLAVPWFVWRHPADLVIEDFAAPNSSDLVPLWTRSAHMAIVQWLFAHEKSKQYHFPFWIAEAAGVRLHQRFIASSRYVADSLQRRNPRAAVSVIYGGVEQPTGAIDTDNERRHLLYLGRLDFEPKGLDLLVEAFSHVPDPTVRLQIAGDGPHRDRLEALVHSAGLQDRVDWLGRVTGDGKWQVLRQAAVLLLPSRYETFGLAALEAMAVGTPVVAFRLPSLVEIVGSECGELVDPYDATALGRAAARLHEDPVRRQAMGKASISRAGTFAWDTAAAEHERVYLEVVRAHQTGRSGAAPARGRSLIARIRSRWADARGGHPRSMPPHAGSPVTAFRPDPLLPEVDPP